MLRQNTTAGVSSRSAKRHLCGARVRQTHMASGGLGHAANRRYGARESRCHRGSDKL